MHNDNFVSFILVFILHFLFLSFAQARNSSLLINRYSDRGYDCLFLSFKETVSNSSLLMNAHCMLFIDTLFQGRTLTPSRITKINKTAKETHASQLSCHNSMDARSRIMRLNGSEQDSLLFSAEQTVLTPSPMV